MLLYGAQHRANALPSPSTLQVPGVLIGAQGPPRRPALQTRRTCVYTSGDWPSAALPLTFAAVADAAPAARTRAKRARPEGPVLVRTRRRSRSSRLTSTGSSTNSHQVPGDEPRRTVVEAQKEMRECARPARSPSRISWLCALRAPLVLKYFSSSSTSLVLQWSAS